MSLKETLGIRSRRDTVRVPTSNRTTRPPEEKVAVYLPDGYETSQFPDDVTRIPEGVAEELGITDAGQELWVKQRPVMHYEDAAMVRPALDEQGMVDPIKLTQRLIDETVTESNFGLPDTPIMPRCKSCRTLFDAVGQNPSCPACGGETEEYFIAESLAWWLTKWLGAQDLIERIGHAAGVDIDRFRHGSGGS